MFDWALAKERGFPFMLRARVRGERNGARYGIRSARPGGVIRLDVKTRDFGGHEYGSIGAGYIGGFTIYAARNSGSARWAAAYRGKLRRLFGIEIGVTRNANKVPYASDF